MTEEAKYNKKAPPPCYIPFKIFSQPKATQKNAILNGLEVNDKGILQ